MTWNHRVVQTADTDGSPLFAVYEVYYDDAGIPSARTEDAVRSYCESVDELRRELERMLKCLDKPLLTDADFKGNGEDI